MKKISFILLTALICTTFSGCYDNNEIDDFAYVIAIGIDKASSDNVKVTLQLAKPTSMGSDEKAGGEGGEKTSITTLESPSVSSALNVISNYIGKQINLSHTKVMIISNEVAREGVAKYVYALPRAREYRPTMYIAVSRGLAEDYIKSVKPSMVANPAKYYELAFAAYKYTGYAANTQMHFFLLQQKSTSQQSVATLVGVSKKMSPDTSLSKNSTYKEKGKEEAEEGDFLAGEREINGSDQEEIMGLAVFDGSKMVGELDGEETTFYLMASNQYNMSNITIPDPITKKGIVTLSVKKSRNTIHKVSMNGNKPFIYVKIVLEADMHITQSSVPYAQTEKYKILERVYSDYIKQGSEKLLTKTATVFKSDICGFGKDMAGKFLTWDEWEGFNWLSKYKDSEFKVEVDFSIRRPGLIIETIPIRKSEGTEE